MSFIKRIFKLKVIDLNFIFYKFDDINYIYSISFFLIEKV
jgi:hypothetical protein